MRLFRVSSTGELGPDMTAPGRQWVGLLTMDPGCVLEEGMQLILHAEAPAGTRSLGHVTSSYGEATLGHSIALAMVADGRTRQGETLFVQRAVGAMPVRVTGPVFLDPEGVRLNA